MSQRIEGGTVVVAAIAGASAVALGAFGAHALHEVFDERALALWRTAVDYQSWHAVALLAGGFLARGRSPSLLRVAVLAFALGIVLFCGSLYALALGAPRILGAVTPLGGVAFIAGWSALGLHGWRTWRAPDPP